MSQAPSIQAMVYTITWTLGIYLFSFSFLSTNTFFFSGFIYDLLNKEHQGLKEKAEKKTKGGQGLETHLHLKWHISSLWYGFFSLYYLVFFFFYMYTLI